MSSCGGCPAGGGLDRGLLSPTSVHARLGARGWRQGRPPRPPEIPISLGGHADRIKIAVVAGRPATQCACAAGLPSTLLAASHDKNLFCFAGNVINSYYVRKPGRMFAEVYCSTVLGIFRQWSFRLTYERRPDGNKLLGVGSAQGKDVVNS